MFKQQFMAIWNDESAQGAVEYILLLVVVVAIGLIFKQQITSAVQSKLQDLQGGMGQFTTQGQ